MLRKLLKYEIKASSRRFFPLYGAVLAASLLMNIAIRFPNLEALAGISGLALFASFIALAVLTLSTIIQRFKRNLLSDEGYLMFTLPVSSEKLILSKLISAVFWTFLSGLVSILSFFIIMFNKEIFSQISTHYDEIMLALKMIQDEHIFLAVAFGVCVLLQFMHFILLIYASLSVAQMAVFNNHRRLASFGAFVVLTVVLSIVVESIFSNIFPNPQIHNIGAMTTLFGVASLVNLSLCVIMFFLTDYLLKNHLNIE